MVVSAEEEATSWTTEFKIDWGYWEESSWAKQDLGNFIKDEIWVLLVGGPRLLSAFQSGQNYKRGQMTKMDEWNGQL